VSDLRHLLKLIEAAAGARGFPSISIAVLDVIYNFDNGRIQSLTCRLRFTSASFLKSQLPEPCFTERTGR
jgi:hypothetical protein